jgi:hypothetical protein
MFVKLTLFWLVDGVCSQNSRRGSVCNHRIHLVRDVKFLDLLSRSIRSIERRLIKKLHTNGSEIARRNH